ncbi:MAG: hypothetical protein K2L87_00450 [Clostridiales bacterium]|nr:hypothetical protein [Clostridiales bacterium]
MPRKKKNKQKPKEKVVYYDDNSTVADMSGTHKKEKTPRQKATFREKARTYFAVVRKMILPMLCTLAAFGLIYLFLLLITGKLF